VWNGTLPGNDTVGSYILANSTYPTEIRAENAPAKDWCSTTHHFGEFGEYSLDVTTCNVVEIRPQSNSLLYVVYALAAAASMRLTWAAGVRIASCRRLRSWWLSRRLRGDNPANEGDAGPSLAQSLAGSDQSLLQELDDSEAQEPEEEAPRPQSRRLKSLDIFRGLTVALMIFVNAGSGGYVYLKHVPWNGLSLADLVFPWFLWIMGFSLVLSLNSQLRRGARRRDILWKAARRSLALVIMGVCLNSGRGRNDVRTLRLPGVLQRIGLAYFPAAALEAAIAKRDTPPEGWISDLKVGFLQLIAALMAVVAHTLMTFLMPVPGCPTGYLGPGGLADNASHANCTGGAAGFIDRSIFGQNHMYLHPTAKRVYGPTVAPYDPEGLLGVLTSFTLVVLGAHAGRIVLAHPTSRGRSYRWILWAIACGLISGFLCNWSKEDGAIPVNKNLWSLSYILAAAASAFVNMAVSHNLVDNFSLWSGSPFIYAGMNPIVVYAGSEILGAYLPLSWRPFSRTHVELLVMNCWSTSFWLFIAYFMHRRGVFIAL